MIRGHSNRPTKIIEKQPGKPEKRRPEETTELERIALAAKAAGISYGKYILRTSYEN